MARNLTEDQCRSAEQIIRRWTWARMLSAQADRTVEQGAVGGLAVALLEQLLGDDPRGVVETSR